MPVPIQDIRKVLNEPDSPIVPTTTATIPSEVRQHLGLPLGEGDISGSLSPATDGRSDPPVSPSPPSKTAPMNVIRQELGLPEGGELPENALTDFTRGIRSGIHHTGTSLLGARAIYNAFQGDETEARELMERVKEREYEGVRKFPRAAPKFSEIKDIPDFVRYAAATLGETVPAIAGVITSAAAGRVAGGTGAGAGTALILSRLVGKKAITKKAAEQMGKKLGGTAGAFGGYATIEGGSTATEQITELGELHPGVATAAGAAKGAIGIVGVTALASRFGLTNDLSGGLINKIVDQASKKVPGWAAAVAGYGLAEGVTEATEEIVDVAARKFVDENYEALGPEARERLLEAGAAGTIVGMVMGPIFGGIGGRDTPQIPSPVEPQAQPSVPPTLQHPLALPSPETSPPQLTLPPPADHSTTYVDSSGTAAGQLDELLPSYVDSQGNITHNLPEVQESNNNFEVNGLNSTGTPLLTEEEVNSIQKEIDSLETETLLEDGQSATPLNEEETSAVESIAPPTIQELMQMKYPVALSRLLKGTVPRKKLAEPITRGVRSFGDEKALKLKPVKKIVSFYKNVIDELGLDNNITVLIQKEFTSDAEGLNLHYNKKENRPHLDIIALNPELPVEEFYTNAIHELGHLLKFTYFKDAPQEIKDALFAEFNQQVAAAEANPREFMQSTVGLGVASRLANAYKSVDELSVAIHGGEAAYFVNFDEWMAEQLVRAQTISRTRLSATEKWLSELAGLMRKMFHIAKKYLPKDAGISKRRDPITGQMIAPFEQFSASKPFEQYLEYIRNKKESEGSTGLSLSDFSLDVPQVAEQRSLRITPEDRAQRVQDMRRAYEKTMVEAATESFSFFVDTAELSQIYNTVDVKAFGTPEDLALPNVQRIINYYKEMINELNLNVHLSVFFHGEISGTRNGYAFSLTEQDIDAPVAHTGIVLETKHLAHVIGATPVHELGHVIHELVYKRAPRKIQRFLFDTFVNQRKEVFLDIPSFLTTFVGAQRGQQFAERWQGKFEQLGGFLEDNANLDNNYWLSFSEWMAEQLVRTESHVVTESVAASTWLKGLKNLLNHLYDRTANILENEGHLNQGQYTINATSEYIALLNYAQGRRKSTGEGLLIAEKFKTLKQDDTQISREKNRKILARQGILPEIKTSNSESAPPQFSGNAEIAGMFKKAKVPEKEVQKLRANADRMNWAMSVALNLQQIATENKKIRPLQDYNDLTDLRYIAQMTWVTRANDTVRHWLSLGRKQGEALTKFLNAVDRMEYLEDIKTDPRLPTEQELAVLAQKYQMSPKALEVYEEIKNDFAAVFDHIEQVSLVDATRTIKNPEKLTLETIRIQTEFATLRTYPYLPHSRFGEYAIVSRDSETGIAQYVEHFESHRAAKANINRISKLNPEATTIIRRVPKNVQSFQGLPSIMLEKIREKLDPTLADDQKAWLDDYINELALSTGMRKQLAKRKDIPGHSLDAMRAYASYFTMNALHFSRIEYGPLMEDAINQMERENATMSHLSDASRRDQILHFMQDNYQYTMNPKGDWEALRSYAFFHWIAYHVKSAVLNLTQVPLVGYPYLAAQYGDSKAVAALGTGYKNIRSMYKGNTEVLTDDYLSALDRAIVEGVVDESQASELAGMSQGGALSSLLPGNKAHRTLLEFNKYGAYVFQAMEKLNRRVTFQAGWELALENNDSKYIDDLVTRHKYSFGKMLDEGISAVHARAYLAAKDAVRATQYQYAKHTRPKFMRGKAGILFTFFQFTQQTLYFAARQPGQGRFLLMMLAMGGLMGMPGAEDLMAISKTLANMLAKRGIIPYFNPELEARKLIIDMSNGDIPPDLVLLGASRYGFGIPAAMDAIGVPVANFDMSGSMSLGQIVPGLQALINPSGFGFDENLSRAMTDISGAALGPGLNMMKAVGDDKLPPDDFKRWERATQRSLANIAKSYRWSTEGKERTRSGATVAEFDLSDPYHRSEIFMQTLGFPPTRIAQRWDREMAVREVEAYWQGRKKLLFDRFDQSFILNDVDMRNEARRDMTEFNKQVPYAPMRFNVKSLIQSRKARIRERRMFEAGYGVGKAAIPLAQEVGSLYPEVENFDNIK